MSSTFIELGALVLAAFALGLLVGWMAWGNGVRRDADRRSARDRTGSPSDDDLPRWRAHRLPSDRDLPRASRRRLAKKEPTVVVGPRWWAAARER